MTEIFKNKIVKNSVLIVLIIVLVGGGYYFGYGVGYKKGVLNPQKITVQGVDNLNTGNKESVDFNLFWQAWSLIKDKFVTADKLNNQDLVYGAITGMFGALGDPNTNFFPPSDAKKFGEDISGEFSGIGAEIGIKDQLISVVAPLKDSPAEKAGLKSGDKILKINDTETLGMATEDAVKIIRGERGTTVKLTVLRDGWSAPKEISITRDTIQVPTADFEMKEDGIAYIHLYNFYEKAPMLFYQSVLKAAINNPRGLILDLRNNPGGYLEAAVNIAGWFFEPGQLVVSEEFRSGEPQVYKANGSGLLKDLPMVVLVNQGSASASEILAGALRDNRNIKLIGTKTFGKGTVQELSELLGGSLAKITIAHWVMPNGKIIDKNGIEPDFEVDITEDDAKSENDPQLAKAIGVLKEEISKVPYKPFVRASSEF